MTLASFKRKQNSFLVKTDLKFKFCCIEDCSSQNVELKDKIMPLIIFRVEYESSLLLLATHPNTEGILFSYYYYLCVWYLVSTNKKFVCVGVFKFSC